MSKANGKAASPWGGRRTGSSRHPAVPTSDAAHRPATDGAGDDEPAVVRAVDARELLNGRLALPVPEVAKLLGISSAAVRLMIARGNLPGRKVGGGTERITFIVPTGALLSWLDGTLRTGTGVAQAG